MCRWLAYTGAPITMDGLLLKSEHSMIDQSKHALQAMYEINADGFGVGWYGSTEDPGLYHDVRPIWNDGNFRDLAHHVQSHLFFCHIRASSEAPVVQVNCHPFRYGRWLFQHNGDIGRFGEMRHALATRIDPGFYQNMNGSTDTETMFHLALTHGLMDDPVTGIRRMIEDVELERTAFGIEDPFRMTVAISDGESLWAFRYASHGEPPSLYHSKSKSALYEASGSSITLSDESVIILSEPLDSVSEHWAKVPPSSVLIVHAGSAEIQPLFG
jgi:predicted glutamine amidotransferase